MHAVTMKQPIRIPPHDLLERINILATAASTAAQFPDMVNPKESSTPLDRRTRSNSLRNPLVCGKCSSPLTTHSFGEIPLFDECITFRCKQCNATQKVYASESNATSTCHAQWKLVKGLDSPMCRSFGPQQNVEKMC